MKTRLLHLALIAICMAAAPAVALAQAAPAGAASAATNNRTIGACQLIGNPDPEDTAVNVISSDAAVQGYFYSFENRNLKGAAQVSILKNPVHGKLEDVGEGGYRYRPAPGYLGNDSTTVLVEMGGYKVKVVYVFHVLEGPLIGDTRDLYDKLCPKQLYRISVNTSRDPGASDLLAWQRSIKL
jgi:hypothetical protein